jgi:hypothetical protein
MSIVIVTEIDIDTTPNEVWDVLADFPPYGVSWKGLEMSSARRHVRIAPYLRSRTAVTPKTRFWRAT